MASPVYVIHNLDKNYDNLYAPCNEIHSDYSAHIHSSIKIGGGIFVREKEYGQGHLLENSVQFLGGG